MKKATNKLALKKNKKFFDKSLTSVKKFVIFAK